MEQREAYRRLFTKHPYPQTGQQQPDAAYTAGCRPLSGSLCAPT